MRTLYRKPVVAFDVDGTLFDTFGQPRRDIVGLLFSLLPYCEIIVWSGSGRDYAKHAGRQLFLPPEVRYFAKMKTPKELYEQEGRIYPTFSGRAHMGIDIAFDDEDVYLADINVKV